MKEPTIGRIVHYHRLVGDQLVTRPAIVTHAWNETTVQLNVHNDPFNDRDPKGQLRSPVEGVSSAMAYEGDHTDPGDDAHETWTWPPVCSQVEDEHVDPVTENVDDQQSDNPQEENADTGKAG